MDTTVDTGDFRHAEPLICCEEWGKCTVKASKVVAIVFSQTAASFGLEKTSCKVCWFPCAKGASSLCSTTATASAASGCTFLRKKTLSRRFATSPLHVWGGKRRCSWAIVWVWRMGRTTPTEEDCTSQSINLQTFKSIKPASFPPRCMQLDSITEFSKV